MTQKFRLTMAQLNATVGDLAGNAAQALEAWKLAKGAGADMVMLPEMFVTGYQVQDLVLKPAFTRDAMAQIQGLAQSCDEGPAMGIGGPFRDETGLYNAYYILAGGRIQTVIKKHILPNDDVFDEKRLYQSADVSGPYRIGNLRIGTPICEDAWHADVPEALAESGAEVLFVPNGSPYARGKMDVRMAHMVARVVETGLPLVYVNMVGGQDELVYDGGSFAINAGGKLACHLPSFSESIVVVSAQKTAGMVTLTGQISPPDGGLTALYRGLCLGLRDYVHKNGFPGVALGLSGGIDSALVAALAVDALGADAVHAVMMPSAYTSQESLDDAAELASALGIRLDNIAITPAMGALSQMLAEQFAGTEPNVAEENIQSRLRGLILMGISNKHGSMVLATGNKSEYAAGYSTLYGDMCGGYAPLKDVWKVDVFRLCHWRNQHLPRGAAGPDGIVIPQRIIDKPPSAELRPDQKDTDSLPPYDRLDAIMAALCEDMADIETIVGRGYDRAEVVRASELLFRAEYKRFQAAPGPKMTPVAFGRDRRLPLTSGFNPIKP